MHDLDFGDSGVFTRASDTLPLEESGEAALVVRRSEGRDELTRFRAPAGVGVVTLRSREITTLDKLSHRPDFYHLRIRYWPDEWVLGSRGLRLFLQHLRDYETSTEDLARVVAEAVARTAVPHRLDVRARARARGGVTIDVDASWWRRGQDQKGWNYARRLDSDIEGIFRWLPVYRAEP